MWKICRQNEGLSSPTKLSVGIVALTLVSALPFPSNRLHANLRGHPGIFMMEPADAHQLDDLPLFWRLDWPAVRRIPR
jgi:hypothetical protein